MIESLLSLESTKSATYPTVESLLANPFFSNAIGGIPSEAESTRKLKLSTSTKEALARHKNLFETRLQEDYKRFKLQEKEKKRQDVLANDNLRKKRQLKNQASFPSESIIIPKAGTARLLTYFLNSYLKLI